MSPCGLGIQTREVSCIHEVTRGTGNTVQVPNHMCPQPPPADRQYCNVWDCPVDWNVGEWSKVFIIILYIVTNFIILLTRKYIILSVFKNMWWWFENKKSYL